MEPIIIDLQEQSLHEGAALSYRTLGLQIQRILGAMFKKVNIPTTVKGTRQQIESFINALSKERKYMSAYFQYGLDDPRTYRNRAKLDAAVSSFERVTNIRWPFK